MARVDFLVNGRNYGVSCDAGQEDSVRELAADLDSRVRSLNIPSASEAQLLLLTSLQILSELRDIRVNGQKSGDSYELHRAAGTIEALASRIESLAVRVGNA